MDSVQASSAIVPTYARANVAFERGEGCWLISTSGERYLDFGAGIAVTSVGHAHPHLVERGFEAWIVVDEIGDFVAGGGDRQAP